MAGPNLTAYIRLDGIDKANQQLKQLEVQGAKTAAAISGSKGAATITAISTGYMAASTALSGYLRFARQAMELAVEDQKSIIARNTALKMSGDLTGEYSKALEAQASAYQKLYGIEDSETRALQARISALGANKEGVEDLTKAAMGLAQVTGKDAVTSVVALERFLNGTTNTIKGTTIAVNDNATAQERWAAAVGIANTGLETMAQQAEDGALAFDKLKQASSEFIESLGKAEQKGGAGNQIDMLTNSLWRLTDWVDRYGGTVATFLNGLSRGILALNTLGLSEVLGAPVPGGGGADKLNPNSQAPTISIPGGGGGGGRHGGGSKRNKTGPAFEWLLFTMPTIQDLLDLQTQKAMQLANFIAGSSDSTGWSDGMALARSIKGTGLRAGRVFDYDPTGTLSRMFGAGAWGGLSPAQAARRNQIGNVAGGIFGGITNRAQNLPQHSGRWSSDDIAGILMQVIGGDFKGAGTTAGSIIGEGAFGKMGGLLGSLGGPLGGLVGGWLGGGLGKLFGGGKKKQRDGQTNATAFIFQSPQLEDIRVAILRLAPSLRASGGGINSTVRNIALQAAR